MRLREGTPVYTWDDQDVGRIARVVMHPKTRAVSHVVIRQGFLFTEDKVVPIEWFEGASEEKAWLRRDAEALDDLPKFEEEHYVPAYMDDVENDYAPDSAEPLYWYPPAGFAPYGVPALYGTAPAAAPPYEPEQRYVRRVEQNIPDDAIALNEGAKVFSSDGEHVGNVREVIVNSGSDYASHIVISRGLLLKEYKLIPTMWFSTVSEDEIYLSVNTRYITHLPDYEA